MSVDISKIYSAVYSGVPVYEMMCRGIAVMRRRCDSYLNATQILKVAGIEKGKRTKILEREVLHGTHEKVQGGYGKYQGTWVPFERGVELAEQYEVEECLHPLLYYNPTANGSKDKTPTKEQAREQAIAAQKSQAANINSHKRKQSSPAPPSSPVLKRTKSESGKGVMNQITSVEKSQYSMNNRMSDPPRKKHKLNGSPPFPSTNNGYNQTAASRHIAAVNKEVANPSDPYRTALMGIFMSDHPTELPELLHKADLPVEFSFDMAIDEQGHSAVHWAAALGHVQVLEQLISKGADSLRLNNNQECALIRAVLVTNNYDRRTFPQIVELLQENLPLTDHKHRTVFHHITAMGGTKSRLLSANYYMETALNWLSQHPDLYPDILDIQDKKGDTALSIAARQNTKSLIKLLLDAKANPEIANNNGVKPNDMELVKETLRNLDHTNQHNQKIEPVASNLSSLPDLSGFVNDSDTEENEETGPSKQCLEFIQAVQSMATELDSTYVTELKAKKRQLREMSNHIKAIGKELDENRRLVQESQSQANRLIEAQMKVSQLERALKQKDEQLRKYITAAPVAQSHSSLTLAAHDNDLEPPVVGEVEQQGPMEGRYKKLIAACCDIPVDRVDKLLEPLLHTLEGSDSTKVDIEQLTRFMVSVRDRERMPQEPSLKESAHESLVIANTAADPNLMVSKPTLIMNTGVQKPSSQTNATSIHEWSSCASSLEDTTASRSTPSITSSNDIS
ncbi:apses-domain-containing protein [Basidiobolus meristosporus CBS 931.73]|uniref:Apses-domain-containing protein n=1 Tax=Basidiobolus meristosporus CBS 931.73 TaxID=1314790 RepID=A0A1Y1Y6T6_9FUNG|nr:apses-domain-containing protein [Basidiobolus meristosporus CBS 931.73]|eukprot:ORX93723.1 apses-domain-containing protein [Basidiobolus meristosporus CBS 931.73]